MNILKGLIFQIKYDQQNLKKLKDFLKNNQCETGKKGVKDELFYRHSLVKKGPRKLADFFVQNKSVFENSFSLLNIGIGLNIPPAWLTFFQDILGYNKIASIEIWKPYIDEWPYQKKFPVWHADVRDLAKILPPKSVDTVLWAHGPEHVKMEEFASIYPKLKSIARHHLLFVTPWGDAYDYQEDFNNNPFEIHHLKKPDERIYAGTNLQQINWGQKNTPQGGLLAYEFIQNGPENNWHENFIVHLAEILRPKVYVELGTYQSTLFNRIIPFANKLIGVDCDCSLEKFMQKSPKTKFYCAKTDEYLKILKKQPLKIDLLFIDADHSASSVMKDFKNFFPFVSEQGIILLHDGFPKNKAQTRPGYCCDAYKTIIKLSKNNQNYEIMTLPVAPGLTICRKRKKHLPWSKQ